MSETVSTVTFDLDTLYTMAEAKALLKKNRGQPLPGLKFLAENKKGERVQAVVLDGLSAKGKLRAELQCLEGGPAHVREQSDWHQSLRSPKSARQK